MASTNRRRCTTNGAIALCAALAVAACGSGSTDGPESAALDTADNRYVGSMAGASEVENFDTIDDALDSADVVLSGTPRSPTISRALPPDEPEEQILNAEVLVEVTDVLRGSLEDAATSRDGERELVSVEFVLGETEDLLADLETALPAGESIWLLRHKGTEGRNLGLPEEQLVGEDRFYRLVNTAGLIGDEAGTAYYPIRPPDPPPATVPGLEQEEEPARFPDNARDLGFDEVLELARS